MRTLVRSLSAASADPGQIAFGRLGQPGEDRDGRSGNHGARSSRRQVALGQRVGQLTGRLQRFWLEHSGDAREENEEGDPGDVQDEGDDPKARNGALAAMPLQSGGDGDEEVLGEQLRSADGQKHEACSEGQRTQHVRGGLWSNLGQRPGGHDEGQQAERHVKSAQQACRG